MMWMADPDDPRTKAALEKKCPACSARPGRECGWWRGGHFWRLETGIVHQIRVPIRVLHGKEVA